MPSGSCPRRNSRVSRSERPASQRENTHDHAQFLSEMTELLLGVVASRRFLSQPSNAGFRNRLYRCSRGYYAVAPFADLGRSSRMTETQLRAALNMLPQAGDGAWYRFTLPQLVHGKDGIPELVVESKPQPAKARNTNEVDNLGCSLCRGHHFSFSSLFWRGASAAM